MISGLRTPKSIGIYDIDITYKLMKIYKTCIFYSNPLKYILSTTFAIIMTWSLSLNCSIVQFVFICIPHIILFHFSIFFGLTLLFVSNYLLLYYSLLFTFKTEFHE